MSRYAGRLRLGGGDVEFREAVGSYLNAPMPLSGLFPAYTNQPRFTSSLARGTDLVHFTEHPLGRYGPAFRPNPWVVTCHDLFPLLHPQWRRDPRGLVVKWLYARGIGALAAAPSVIAISEFTARQVREVLSVPSAKVSVVPVALDPAFRLTNDAEEWLIRRGISLPPGPRIVSVGHARRLKNLEVLIEALPSPLLESASLIRVGNPLSLRQRQRIDELQVGQRVCELGTIPDEILIHLLNASTVLVQPSFSEGFGMPVVEAMACGLPVVTSDGGALPEVAGDAAVIVPLTGDIDHPPSPADIAAFAEAIGEVIRNRQLSRRLRDLGLARAARYTPVAVQPQLLAAYTATLQRFGK